MEQIRHLLNDKPMSRLQVLAVLICVTLNALDGIDVLAITFAAPGIAEQWHIGPGALGIVISMGLIGMAAGSLLVAPFADVIGRRKTILGCLILMSAGMFASASAQNVIALSLFRILTGIGIGGMLGSINAMVAEFANARSRDFAVALMTIGYPIGGVAGGSVAAWLLLHHGWQSVFLFGAICSAAILPVVYFALPESIDFLVTRAPADALVRINRTLQQMGHPAIRAMTRSHIEPSKAKLTDIFSRDMIGATSAITIGYFCHTLTFYYILGWVPSIVTDLGFAKATGSAVSVWVNLGGILGGGLLGFAARIFPLKHLLVATLLATAISLALFGHSQPALQTLKLIGFALGFFMFGGVVGLYAFMARIFPTHVRATGTGFVIGIGRGGGALGPALAGLLIASGLDRSAVASIMALGSVIAIGATLMLSGATRPSPAVGKS